MPFLHSENKLDNELFLETSKKYPDEDKIKKLIQDGANINAVDCIKHTVIGNLISAMDHEKTDIKYLQFLINLGADINLRVGGMNCLFDAVFTYRKDIFELLLKEGADPNCIIDDEGITILDMIIDDKYFCEMENDINEGKIQEEIENLLVNYGAKQSKELFTTELNKYIWINNAFITGIITYNGNIKPENIPNINKETVIDFNNWLNSKPNDWNLPKELYQKYYNDGINIAYKIKKLLDKNIEVKINYLTCEEWGENSRGKYKYKLIE